MKITFFLSIVISLAFVGQLSLARSIPKDPSTEYEIIDPKNPPILPNKPSIEEMGHWKQNDTFAYDPTAKSWTVLKPTDEVKEGTLLWNQKDDKWLTQSFTP